jgi:hypothetical protein
MLKADAHAGYIALFHADWLPEPLSRMRHLASLWANPRRWLHGLSDRCTAEDEIRIKVS